MKAAHHDRFMAKVVPEPNTGCWLWAAYLDSWGYGVFRLDGRTQRAHRVAYELLRGPIGEGLQIDHLCRTPACVNPDHMEPVTGRVNSLRSTSFCAREATQTHCVHGHPFDERNTYQKDGRRMCRACAVVRSRKYMAKKRAAIQSAEVAA